MSVKCSGTEYHKFIYRLVGVPIGNVVLNLQHFGSRYLSVHELSLALIFTNLEFHTQKHTFMYI